MLIELSPELSSPRKDFCGFWCEYCEGFCSVPNAKQNSNIFLILCSTECEYDVMTSTHRKLQNIVNDMSSANNDKLNPIISSIRVRPAISIFVYQMRMKTKCDETMITTTLTVSGLFQSHTNLCFAFISAGIQLVQELNHFT